MGVTVFYPAPTPNNEHQRGQAVLRSGLLTAQADARLARLVDVTRANLDAAWCAIVVIHGDMQHVIVSTGGHLGPHRRYGGISTYVIHQPGQTFVVLDTAATPEFEGSRFVIDGLIRFYAGSAIVDPDGYPLGALCVTDRKPRASFTPENQVYLEAQAAMVIRPDLKGS